MESQQSPSHDTIREREHYSRLSALSNFSLSDMFDSIRDGSKSVKFPEKLVKVLEQKLQAIAMGKEPGYVLFLLSYTKKLKIVTQILRPISSTYHGPILRPVLS